MRIIRHGLGLFTASLIVIWALSLIVCFHILGLILDVAGALILAATAIPWLRNHLYRMEFGPFRTASRIDDAIDQVFDGNTVSFESGDPEFADIDEVSKYETLRRLMGTPSRNAGPFPTPRRNGSGPFVLRHPITGIPLCSRRKVQHRRRCTQTGYTVLSLCIERSANTWRRSSVETFSR